MIILTLRTDKPEAELGLFDDTALLAQEKWQAHRQLAETLHTKIQQLLASQDKEWHNLEGIVAFRGPGSFTGLRIGLSVANALASSLNIPVHGTMGEDWQTTGLQQLVAGVHEPLALPEYGAPANITAARK